MNARSALPEPVARRRRALERRWVLIFESLVLVAAAVVYLTGHPAVAQRVSMVGTALALVLALVTARFVGVVGS